MDRASRALTLLAGAGLGGCVYGAADALRAVAADHLAPSTIRTLVLMAGDLATMGLMALAAAAPVAVFVAVRGTSRPGRNRWLGFLWGVSACLATEAFERWFTRPPPFQEGLPLQGNPLVFALFLGVLGAVVAGLVRAPGGARSRAVVLMVLLASLTLRASAVRRELDPRGVPPAGATNVVLVTLDTARADHMGAYGNPVVQTPNFDSLADQGVLFTTAMSTIPVTGPSHTTLLTGAGPWDHKSLLNGVPLPEGDITLAEALRAEGWRTAAFVSAYVLDGDLGFARGFEVYDDDFGWLQGWAVTTPGRLAAMAGRHLQPEAVLERRGGRTMDSALAWLGQLSGDGEGGPFLLWVHLFDPHGPYQPPPPWDTAYYSGDPTDPAHTSMGQVQEVAPYLEQSLAGITDVEWVRAQYAGEISYVDEQLGRLLDGLDRAGARQDTLVVVCGDHGEALGEHNQWFDHGDDLYEPSSRVPLVMRLPGQLPADSEVAEPVELTDIAPTIYAILDLDPPSTVRGQSLLPLAQSAEGARRSIRPFARAITFDRPHNLAERAAGRIDKPRWRLVALRGADSRYVHHEAEGFGDEVYDLVADPEEVQQADPGPELGGMLRAEAERLLDIAGSDSVQRSTIELDDATRDALEALGYME